MSTRAMPPARLPPHESAGLLALEDYAILDSPAEQSFDRLVALAAEICGTPVATVTFIDHTRQWHKARVGLAVAEAPRDVAFCAHTILQDDLLEVGDLRTDEPFADNPFVVGASGARFYAGQPLRSERGFKLGTLCVIDLQPRVLSAFQRRALETLGQQIELLLTLRIRLRELERTQQKKAELTSFLVHDLKSPLQTILYDVETMLDDSSEARSAAASIEGSVLRLSGLVKGLLEIETMNDGQLRARHEIVELGQLVRDVVSGVTSRAATRGWAVDGAAELISRVMGDRELLRRVIDNLVDNALKYGRVGGTLRFAEVVASTHVEFRVIDDGPGIPSEFLTAIFEPRFRLERDRHADLDRVSHGLGLAFCRRAIEAQHGQIWAESGVPTGATFAIRLPRAP